jgi:Protein of unknown function DUF262
MIVVLAAKGKHHNQRKRRLPADDRAGKCGILLFARSANRHRDGPTRAERMQALRDLLVRLGVLSSRLEALPPQLRLLLSAGFLECRSAAGRLDVDPVAFYSADKTAIDVLSETASDVRHTLARVGRTDEVNLIGDDSLKTILARAGKNEDATLLIPDLQRPYVWQPSQVILLLDSLIRGWPFGTLLTWKVEQDDPARELARSFWRVVDRVSEVEGEPISKRHPPATFQMVLDGQQRIQSLLLALGGDGWGFKLLDREWHEHLKGTKPRGPRGTSHWSIGCLCVDVPALNVEYAKHRRATAIDYQAALKWVVTDDANGQSKYPKPMGYAPALPLASEAGGDFVRLSRLWEAVPDQIIDNYEAEDIAERILSEHGVPDRTRGKQKRALGALLIALREVKQTRVTYLELSEYEAAHGVRDVYNDAIVNIFTR